MKMHAASPIAPVGAPAYCHAQKLQHPHSLFGNWITSYSIQRKTIPTHLQKPKTWAQDLIIYGIRWGYQNPGIAKNRKFVCICMLATIPCWHSFLSYKINSSKHSPNVVKLFDQTCISDLMQDAYTLSNYNVVIISLQQKLAVFWEYRCKYSPIMEKPNPDIHRSVWTL